MLTLQQSLASFLKVDRSRHTNRGYHNILGRMVTAIGPDRDIALVSYDDLADYVLRLRDAVSPATLVQYVQVIHVFFNWCVRIRYLDFSPASAVTVRRPPSDPTEEKSMPPDVYLKVLNYFKQRKSPRDLAIFLFIAYTGCRVGAVASLTIKHLELDERGAWVIEKGWQIYHVRYSRETAQALTAWLKVRPSCDHDFVFVDERKTRRGHPPLQSNGVSSIIHRATAKLSESEADIFYGHSMRHLITDDLRDLGEDPHTIQDYLGHHHVTTTLKYLKQKRKNPKVLAATDRLAEFRRQRENGDDEHDPSGKIIYLDDAG